MTAVPQFDEMLSAYLDGELSPAEAARVEKLLTQSPALQAVVNEYKSLGNEIRTLNVPALGNDFAEGVLAGISQRSLPASRVSGGTSWWSRRTVRAAAVAIVGTGLAAMVMVALRGPAVENNRPDVAINKTTLPVEAGGNSVAGTENAATETGRGAVGAPAEGLKVAATRDPKELVGRIVEAWDPKGVAVVRVVVVDYDATWERLQVVLEDRAFATTSETPETRSGDLVAVLAEGTPDRIGDALAALAGDKGVVAMDVAEQPLLVAALEDRVKAGFAPVAMANRPGFKRPGDVANDDGGLRTRSTGNPGGVPTSRPAAAPVGVQLDTPVAWARPVAIPEGLLPSGQTHSPRNGSTARTDSNGVASPVQVLFVLEERK